MRGERCKIYCKKYSMKKITVVGAGTMGNGIAHLFAMKGYEVAILDVSEAALEKGRGGRCHRAIHGLGWCTTLRSRRYFRSGERSCCPAD